MSDHWDDHGEKPKKHTVGYGRPPKEHRFQKGKSGNPSGRRKGSKSRNANGMTRADALFEAAVWRKVKVKDGGIERRIPAYEAILHSVVAKAARGDLKSAKLIMEKTTAMEQAAAAERAAIFFAFADYKMEFEHTGMVPIHNDFASIDPRDVELNWETQEIKIRGSFSSRESQETAKHLSIYRDMLICDLALEKSFREPSTETDESSLESSSRSFIQRLNAILPVRYFRDPDEEIEAPSKADSDAAMEYLNSLKKPRRARK